MKRTAMLATLCLVAANVFAGDGVIRRSPKRIPDRYVVVLKSGSDVTEMVNHARTETRGRVSHSYKHAIKGFAFEGKETDAQKLARDPRVELVEEDSIVTAGSSWALDRIDQRSLPLNGTYASSETGAGVTAYVLDTGILASHAEFGGRVRPGFSAFDDGRGTGDCNGHGTHVAGLIGGSTYGVAKSVDLVPVRVLDCNGSGSVSSVLAGLVWVVDQTWSSPNRAVVNMSLNGAKSSALDLAVNAAVRYGVTTVVAAGNGNDDACNFSPARVPGALTVGASTSADERAFFSNHGKCVDVFAPGVNVPSAWNTSTTASMSVSGTSAAAPLAAGVAALYLEKYPDASAVTIAQSVASQASLGVLSLIDDKSPNRLLFSPVGPLDPAVNGIWQLLSDPSFDYGTTFWASDLCTLLNPTGCPPGREDTYATQSFPSKSGNSHASLGARPVSTVITSEVLRIPATVTRAELSFYLWVVTKEKSSDVEDALSIQIRDEAGNVLETVGTFSNLDACPTYALRKIDVTRYRGSSIRISFAAEHDKGPATWFLVDDVELNVWP